VAGFYSGTCAMLDQDPDALIAIDERMSEEDYGSPRCRRGRTARPSHHRLCRLGHVRRQRAQGGILEADRAPLRPAANITWNKRIGALPIYTAAEKDEFYGQPKFAGWFEELGDPNVQPTSMPTYLEEFGYFADSVVPPSSQQALLGQITPEELAKQWADYMTQAQQKFMAAQKQ
jgi:multiple sugar transport system substrate-binding protein